jgi:hypothetical protein
MKSIKGNNMSILKLKVITNRPAPKRNTQPASNWRELLAPMKRGHWFEVKCKTGDKMYNRVGAAANVYCKGRYTFYKVSENRYIFEINKG